MKKIIKSILISTATVGSIFGSITTVISCGATPPPPPTFVLTVEALDSFIGTIPDWLRGNLTNPIPTVSDETPIGIVQAIFAKWSINSITTSMMTKIKENGALTLTTLPATAKIDGITDFQSTLTFTPKKGSAVVSTSSIHFFIHSYPPFSGKLSELSSEVQADPKYTGTNSAPIQFTTKLTSPSQIITELSKSWKANGAGGIVVDILTLLSQMDPAGELQLANINNFDPALHTVQNITANLQFIPSDGTPPITDGTQINFFVKQYTTLQENLDDFITLINSTGDIAKGTTAAPIAFANRIVKGGLKNTFQRDILPYWNTKKLYALSDALASLDTTTNEVRVDPDNVTGWTDGVYTPLTITFNLKIYLKSNNTVLVTATNPLTLVVILPAP